MAVLAAVKRLEGMGGRAAAVGGTDSHSPGALRPVILQHPLKWRPSGGLPITASIHIHIHIHIHISISVLTPITVSIPIAIASFTSRSTPTASSPSLSRHRSRPDGPSSCFIVFCEGQPRPMAVGGGVATNGNGTLTNSRGSTWDGYR